MGNEASTLVDEDTPPTVLERRDLPSVAKYIKEKSTRKIVVMVSVGYTKCLVFALLSSTGWCRHQHLSRNPRLSLA